MSCFRNYSRITCLEPDNLVNSRKSGSFLLVVKLKWNDSCIENDSRRFTYRNYPDAGGSERDTGALQGEKVFVWITPHCRLERYLLYMKDPIQDAYTSTLSIISRHMKITIQRVIGLRIGNLRELKQTMWQNEL